MSISKTTAGRIRRVKKRSFTSIDNQPLKDSKLSWKAKGLLSYLMSLPEDWKIYVSELSKHAKDGVDSTSSGMKELMTNGYIVRERRHEEETGHFKGYDYLVSDIPMKSTETGFSVNGKSKNGKPVYGKSNTTKERRTKEILIQSKKQEIHFQEKQDYPKLNEEQSKLAKREFEIFHNRFKGLKQGFETNYIKSFRHEFPYEWHEIVFKLNPAMDAEDFYHRQLKENNQNIPFSMNIKNWLKGRCWENEFPKVIINQKSNKNEKTKRNSAYEKSKATYGKGQPQM